MVEIIKISLTAFMLSAIIQKDQGLLLWYKNIINKLPWYLCKPLGGCYQCFTGQAMLWYFLLTKPFDLVELGFFISAGILLSMIWHKIYCLLK